MKKRITAMLLAVVMLFSLSACGGGGGDNGDKVYELIVTNHDSSTSVGQAYVEAVLNQISEESGGRLKFVFNSGGSLFGGGEAVDAVRAGSADICWNATSITVGVFPISEFLNVDRKSVV